VQRTCSGDVARGDVLEMEGAAHTGAAQPELRRLHAPVDGMGSIGW
jgi:hypothetical protein